MSQPKSDITGYPSGGARYASQSNLARSQNDVSYQSAPPQGTRPKQPSSGYASNSRGYPNPQQPSGYPNSQKPSAPKYQHNDLSTANKATAQSYPSSSKTREPQNNIPKSPSEYPGSKQPSSSGYPSGYPQSPKEKSTLSNPDKHYPAQTSHQSTSGHPQQNGYPTPGKTPTDKTTSGYPSITGSRDRYPNSSNLGDGQGYPKYPSTKQNAPTAAYTNQAYVSSRENLAANDHKAKSSSQHDLHHSSAKPYPGYPTNSRGTPAPVAPSRKHARGSQGGSSSTGPYSPSGKPTPYSPTTPTSPPGQYPNPRTGYPPKGDAPSAPMGYPQPSPAYSMPNIAQQSASGMKYMSMSDLNQALSVAPDQPQPAPLGHAQSLSAITVPQGSGQPLHYPVVSNQPIGISTDPDGKSTKSPKSDEEEGTIEGAIAGIKRKFKFQKNKNAQAHSSRPTSTLSAAHMAQNAQLQRYGSRLSVGSTQGGAPNGMNSQQGSQWSLNTISGANVNMDPGAMKRSPSMYSVASIKSVNIPRCGSFISLTTATGETKIMAADTFESCHIPALVTAILCFFPTGIVAVMYSMQAKRAYEDGDVIEGRRKAEMARLLVIITVCIGMLCWILGIIALALVVMT